MSEPIRLVLVDDQAMVREGFAALLGAQPDLEVVGTAGNGRVALETIAGLGSDGRAPHVVLMDVRMPELDGIEATRELMARPDPPRVVVLTTFDLDDHVFDALRAGASAFLLKHAPAAELVHAVRVVASGEALLDPSVTRRLIAHFVAARPEQRPTPSALTALTERETEVLRLIARGLSNAEIAAELVLAEQTVKTHVSHVLTKFGLRDRAQAVVLAYETGLVRPSA
ncbi:response regulator [Pseudonocardia endophytica]|uniref:LuxR family two component transcriptional regulator n=1 Tax=Pseudonocardia endophytica TaxID=401976 RepID=A0A4R1HYQ8_PSEEN|nr:response regulator transcription factor [Pseudonocardia endophytica]TCK22712.1 LuxR family two component transcriptional regulator [Pseudonocardia endophytica]